MQYEFKVHSRQYVESAAPSFAEFVMADEKYEPELLWVQLWRCRKEDLPFGRSRCVLQQTWILFAGPSGATVVRSICLKGLFERL